MDPLYKARPLKKSDLPQLFRMSALVFGRQAGETFRKNWEWHFLQNPLRKKQNPRSWVVAMGKEIPGHIAANPGLLKVKDKNIGFIWGSNLMADPNHRGKGIGKEMVKRWKEEHTICLALGVGDLAYGIEHRMGWENVPAAKARIKILNPRAFADFAMKHGIPGRSIAAGILGILIRLFLRTKKPPETAVEQYRLKKITAFDKRFTTFWNRVSKNFPLASVRDQEYLNWKFTKNPSRTFDIFALEDRRSKEPKTPLEQKTSPELRGYCVLTIMKSPNFRWGRIVEFVIDPAAEQEMQAMISHTIRHFTEKKCDGIQVYGLMQGHQDAFRKNGFFRIKKMDQRFIVKVDDFSKAGAGRAFYLNPDNWFVSAGDSDFTL